MCKKSILLGLLLCLSSATLIGCGKQQNMEPVTIQTQEVEETIEPPSTEPEESIQNANIDKLLGQWKVTEHAVSDNSQVYSCNAIMEHFLGRTIVIEENSITKSLYYWPQQTTYVTHTYDYVEKQLELSDEYANRNEFIDDWYEEIQKQKMEVYTFYVGQVGRRGKFEYIILENGKVLCQYEGMYYYMDPYVQAKTDIALEELYGCWRTERLISYQAGWKGNNEDVERGSFGGSKPVLTEKEGANFYPLDYYNATFNLTEDSATLHLEDGTSEQYAIHLFSSQTVDTVSYEKENGIHDRLGVTNEDILVYTANIDGQTDEMLWNGDVIVIDENRIIVKLYQGWYMLVRE